MCALCTGVCRVRCMAVCCPIHTRYTHTQCEWARSRRKLDQQESRHRTKKNNWMRNDNNHSHSYHTPLTIPHTAHNTEYTYVHPKSEPTTLMHIQKLKEAQPNQLLYTARYRADHTVRDKRESKRKQNRAIRAYNLPFRNLGPLFVLMAKRPMVKLFLTLRILERVCRCRCRCMYSSICFPGFFLTFR